ncbi:type VII secretion EssA family protein [Faecalimonas umbilicata]|uniref:type VII secretion EssA family protein n=1 Tax=Faecalimonas umbilicata TaxID=1912855 RepID=UPI0022E081DE|nr:type VII secretion EssA family protein [Faecalimonas umbilicata]
MSENNNIKLDPNVLNQQQNTKVPLSDLYGIPVFSPETDRMVEKIREDQADEVAQIKQKVFGEGVSGENQEIQKIRNQLFQMQTVLTKETIENRKQIGFDHTHFLVIEIMFLVFMVMLLFYQKNRRKKRKEENDTYDYGR